jgi:hypothetical protein
MAFAFDTLGYARHIENAGVGRPQAEAHAEAVRNFVMVELVTKSDLILATDRIDSDLVLLGDRLSDRLNSETKMLRAEMATSRSEIERLIQAQTIRLGGLVVVAVGALAALLRLT